MSLADAVKRAAKAAAPVAPVKEEVALDPYEIAAEEFASAKTSGERADVFRALAELARGSK